MASTMPVRARPLSVIAALALIVLSLGVGGPASADPGNGHGQGAQHSQSQKHSDDVVLQASDSPGKSGSSKGKAGTHSASGTAGTSGDVTEPQPISTADANPGGANGQCVDKSDKGPYCSTRDGAESKNGNGKGKATGKPCAGCVGRADNKNPQGQMPDARHDGNRGYECDGNHGIGKTNPAHTGCTTPPTTVTPECGEPGMPVCPKPPKCDEPDMPTCPTPPPSCGEPSMPTCPVTPPNCDEPNAPECPEPQVLCPDGTERPCTRNRPPATIAGVEDEVPPLMDQPTVKPAVAVLPATGAAGKMDWAAGGGAALVLVGGAALWLQRRKRSTN